ncbi:MAG: hypothetical protein E7641_05375 [Ruminococcaceae bacterium]|nr:hypothetical protein [Oscillospiraceae bacterium]
MKTESKSFILYCDFEEQFQRLSLRERGMLISVIFEYARCGEISQKMSPLVDMAFSSMRAAMDRDRVKYEQRCEANRANGKKGGRPRKSEISQICPTADISAPKTEGLFSKSNKPYNDSESDNKNENDNDNYSDIESESENDIEPIPAPLKKDAESSATPSLSEPTLRSADSVGVSHPLSEEDRDFLKSKGIDDLYLEARLERAAEYARRKGESLRSVLLSWWIDDRGKVRRQRGEEREMEKAPSSFDTDSFFEAACARALRELGG